jgi:hypothetical protein
MGPPRQEASPGEEDKFRVLRAAADLSPVRKKRKSANFMDGGPLEVEELKKPRPPFCIVCRYEGRGRRYHGAVVGQQKEIALCAVPRTCELEDAQDWAVLDSLSCIEKYLRYYQPAGVFTSKGRMAMSNDYVKIRNQWMMDHPDNQSAKEMSSVKKRTGTMGCAAGQISTESRGSLESNDVLDAMDGLADMDSLNSLHGLEIMDDGMKVMDSLKIMDGINCVSPMGPMIGGASSPMIGGASSSTSPMMGSATGSIMDSAGSMSSMLSIDPGFFQPNIFTEGAPVDTASASTSSETPPTTIATPNTSMGSMDAIRSMSGTTTVTRRIGSSPVEV